MSEATTQSGGQLMQNMLLFGRILHGLGIDVSPASMIDVMQTLSHVEIGRKPDFYYTMRSICCNRKSDLPLFDEAFAIFWQKPSGEGFDLTLGELLGEQPTPETLTVPPSLGEEHNEGLNESEEDDDEETQEIIEITKTFSERERLFQKDFGDMTPDELEAVKRLMSQLIWSLGQRITRRETRGKGSIFDMRRSIRNSFRYGGEMLQWKKLTRKIKPRPLVIIADISGSMEQYTRLLLHFLYSLTEGLDQRVEVFVFSTRLTRITRQLRNRDIDRALAEVAQAVPDWSGGTRIGDAIKVFNFDWARRVLKGGAVTILISDGWDRGDPELLSAEMARLTRTAYRFIWLNPLLGSENYEPLTRGIVAALPHLDDFMPVHNLQSLEDLAVHLALLDGKTKAKNKSLKGAGFIGR